MNNFQNKLKSLLFSVFALIASLNIFAQDHQDTIIMSNGTTVSCNALFFDSGLDTASYGNNQNLTYTICPNNDSLQTKVTFTQFKLAIGDSLCISGAGPNPTCFSGTTIEGASFEAIDSCLTFTFKSNASGVDSGFTALVSCNNCQQINPAISLPNVSAEGFIDICPGTTLNFTNGTTYPENNWFYTQSNATSTFTWNIHTFTSTGLNAENLFEGTGLYPIYLTVVDVNGCTTKKNVANVRVSGKPSFAGTTVFPNPVCVGDSIFLNGEATPVEFTFDYGDDTDSLFLPDGDGVIYTAVANVNSFGFNQTLTQASDIQAVCVNMEHSYMGDLTIWLTCPNGDSIEFHSSFGGGTHLGVPIDIDANLNPGVGYNYCWVANSPNGTWEDYVGTFSPSPALPEGDYEPNQNFSNLVGCPLNGVWNLNIQDNLLSDNGYIFSWSIIFDSTISNGGLPIITPDIVSYEWSLNNNTLSTNPIHTTLASVDGLQDFVFTSTDEFGCSFDTTLQINVIGVNAAFTTDLQENAEAPLNISFFNSSTPSTAESTWYIGDSIFSTVYNPLTQTYTNGGEFVVTLVTRNGACIDSISDTLVVLLVNDVPNVFSPNADNLNDVFYVPAIGIGSYAVKIFNRWGKSVFECSTSGLTTECAWDGKVNDGSDAPDGTYYYLIDVLNKAGEPLEVENAQGYVQLMRN